MWVKLKNGELFNLDYADLLYSCKMKSGLYGIFIRKKMFCEKEQVELLKLNDGLTEKEAEEQMTSFYYTLNVSIG